MPSPPPDDFESRITALLLGELAPADADAVQQTIAADPALGALCDRLRKTLSLVREAVAQPAASATSPATQPRLSAKRRESLLRHFKLIAPPGLAASRRRWQSWLIPMSAAAALMVMVALILPAFAKAKSKGQSVAWRRPAIINDLGGERGLERVGDLTPAVNGRPPSEVTRRTRNLPQSPATAPAPAGPGLRTPLAVQLDGQTYVAGGLPRAEPEVSAEVAGLEVRTAPAAPAAGAPSRGKAETARGAEASAGEAGRPMMDIRMLSRYGLLPKGLKLVEKGGPAAPAAGSESIEQALTRLAEEAPQRRQHLAAAPESPAGTAVRGELAKAFESPSRGRPEAAPSAAAAESELAPLPLKLPLPAFMGTPTDIPVRTEPSGVRVAQPAAPPADAPARPAPNGRSAGQEARQPEARRWDASSALADAAAKAKEAQPRQTGIDESAPPAALIDPTTGMPIAAQNNWSYFAQPTTETREKFGDVSGMGGGMGGMGGGGGTLGFTQRGYGGSGGFGGMGGTEGARLFANRGDGAFVGGAAAGRTGGQTTFADYDNNGLTDLYVPGGLKAGDIVLGQQVEKAPEAAEADPAARLFSAIAANTRGLTPESAGTAKYAAEQAPEGPALVAAADAAVPFAVPVEGYVAVTKPILTRAAAPPAVVASVPLTPQLATPVPPPTVAPLTPAASSPAPEGGAERFAAGAYWTAAIPKDLAPAAAVPDLGDVPVLGTLFRESKQEGDAWHVVENRLGRPTTSTGLAAPSAGKPLLSADGGYLARQSEELSRKSTLAEGRKTDEKLAEVEGKPAARVELQVAAANGVAKGPEPQAQEVEMSDKTAPLTALKTNAVAPMSGLAMGLPVAPQPQVITRPLAPPPEPQPEVATASNPFSTFSLNVTDVSFKLAAASLEQGALPDPSRIRGEEFLNAFNYRDPEPVRGAPIAFAWERARYPFAHNREAIRFSVQTAARGRSALRPLNLVLLLDSSGSMERADRVSIIREALAVLARQLQPQDRLSIVAFARTARLWVDGVSGHQANEVLERISHLTPEGGTNLEDALKLAYETASRHFVSHGVNRVVLLTDGAANLGDVDPASLQQKVEAARKQGIALDCFGIGWEGYNDDLLEVLSSCGDGRYGFVNRPEEAASELAGQLAGALQVAAADVKVQVEFNPYRTTVWRQIGYAKHQLTKEQFRDNTVDAAELGAAESGNALYLVEVNPLGQGDLGTVRVRYREAASGLYREHAWRVPYRGPAPLLEQSSAAMRLAVTAGAFSEWLATSPFAGEVKPDKLLGTMFGVTDAFAPDERPRQLEAMIRQAKSISGQ